MHLLPKFRRLIPVAVIAIGAGVWAVPGAGAASAADAAQKPAASDMQKLMSQINSQREKMIADHEALAKQLKDATDEQRKAILAKMYEQKKEFEAAQSALHKQIRDEQRRQRQSAGPGRR